MAEEDASSPETDEPGASHADLDPETLAPATPVAGPGVATDPALALTAGQQVTAALTGLAGVADSAATATSGIGSPGVNATPGTTAAGKVTPTADGGREIVIKLDPEHLGSVSIRLKMNGEKVDVSITVDNPSTLDLLNQDRHMLTSAVSALGLGGPPVIAQNGSDGPSQPSGLPGSGSDMSGASGQDSEAFASGDPAGPGQNRRGNGRTTAGDGVESMDGDAAVPIAQARTEGLYV